MEQTNNGGVFETDRLESMVALVEAVVNGGPALTRGYRLLTRGIKIDAMETDSLVSVELSGYVYKDERTSEDGGAMVEELSKRTDEDPVTEVVGDEENDNAE